MLPVDHSFYPCRRNPSVLALVTGACSGIGLEIARELAGRGYSLALVSNRRQAVEEAAQAIEADYSVRAHPIALDLTGAQAARELYEEITALGAPVDVLVNNAGMFFFGEVVDADPDDANSMLQLHVVTPSLLAREFGRDMRARRRGHIMFVSSASAWNDFPGVALYGSSKRYIRSFASALRHELEPWGVNVTCLAPGAVSTGFYGRESNAARVAGRLRLVEDPRSVARAGVEGMLKRKALVLPGFGAKAMVIAMALTPRWLIGVLRRRTGFLPKPD